MDLDIYMQNVGRYIYMNMLINKHSKAYVHTQKQRNKLQMYNSYKEIIGGKEQLDTG